MTEPEYCWHGLPKIPCEECAKRPKPSLPEGERPGLDPVVYQLGSKFWGIKYHTVEWKEVRTEHSLSSSVSAEDVLDQWRKATANPPVNLLEAERERGNALLGMERAARQGSEDDLKALLEAERSSSAALRALVKEWQEIENALRALPTIAYGPEVDAMRERHNRAVDALAALPLESP